MPKGFELLVLLVCSLTLEKCKHCLCKFKAQSNLKPVQTKKRKAKPHLLSTCVSWNHLWGIFLVTPAAGAGAVDWTAKEVLLGLVGCWLGVSNDRVA